MLILPVLLVLTMVVLDFGRVYLGYINLQNMTRIAANFAANNPTAWTSPGDVAIQARYKNQILNDARATNCTIAKDGAGNPIIPPPVFTDTGANGSSTDIGDTSTVQIRCTFSVITPIISTILGSSVKVSSSATFPVKTGFLATSGGSMGSGPAASFVGSPTSGNSPLTVQFTDQSAGGPTSWVWDFNNDGIADSNVRNPQYTFTGVGLYTVKLVVSNASGSDTRIRTNYIGVSTPPPGVNFTASPPSGIRPLTVQFTDTSTGSPTAWAWDFDNNGTTDSTLPSPTHTYTTSGTYSVKLTVTNAGGQGSKVVPNMITVNAPNCVVPSFAGKSSSLAPGIWSTAGFTTTVNYKQGNLPWTVASQNQTVGQSLPCDSTIVTVSKN